MLASVCEQLEHIWKPLQITEGWEAEVRRGRAESRIITTAHQTTSSLCLQLAPVRR